MKLDDRDSVSPGCKFNDWEMKGVPVRLEIGPRDLENGVVMAMRRDTLEKFTVPAGRACNRSSPRCWTTSSRPCSIRRRISATATPRWFTTWRSWAKQFRTAFAKAMWCGDRACEDKIKDEFNASSRNMPFDQEGEACRRHLRRAAAKKPRSSCTSPRRIKEEGGGKLRGRRLL